MAFTMTTPNDTLNAFFAKCIEIVNDEFLMALTKLGEECVVKVRDRSFDESWIDHTANLRSSIGYSVYQDGESLIQSAFETVKSGSTGSAEGRKMVNDLAKQYSDTLALVVVAAMDYADKVEAIESKDVLESTRIWAQSVVQERLEKAKEVAINKINALTL